MTNVFRLNLRQMYIVSGLPKFYVLGSLFAWSLLARICNIQGHTNIGDIFRTFSKGSSPNLVNKKRVFVLLSIPPLP